MMLNFGFDIGFDVDLFFGLVVLSCSLVFDSDAVLICLFTLNDLEVDTNKMSTGFPDWWPQSFYRIRRLTLYPCLLKVHDEFLSFYEFFQCHRLSITLVLGNMFFGT